LPPLFALPGVGARSPEPRTGGANPRRGSSQALSTVGVGQVREQPGTRRTSHRGRADRGISYVLGVVQ